MVEGDIGYDNGSDPSQDQFALPGLSDTLNLVGIYEKDGLSARLAYNWRDDFLNQVNRNLIHQQLFHHFLKFLMLHKFRYNHLLLNLTFD